MLSKSKKGESGITVCATDSRSITVKWRNSGAMILSMLLFKCQYDHNVRELYTVIKRSKTDDRLQLIPPGLHPPQPSPFRLISSLRVLYLTFFSNLQPLKQASIHHPWIYYPSSTLPFQGDILPCCNPNTPSQKLLSATARTAQTHFGFVLQTERRITTASPE
jgi:hypothetical protein